MRALLLLGCVVAACGGGKTAPPPAPGNDADPAGKVVAIDGKVTAQRPAAGAPVRALVRDDAVFADDTITTAPQASVKILLTHNHVTWSLEADQARRVDQSLAWTAAEGSTSADVLAGQTEDHTAAAGRHVESEGMTTAATIENPPGGSPPPAQAQAIAEPPPVQAAKPPPKPRSAEDELGDVVTGKGEGGLGIQGVGSGGGGAGDGKGIGLGNIGGGGSGAGAPSHANDRSLYPRVSMSIDESPPLAAVTKALAAQIPGVKQCYQVALNKDPSVLGELRFALTINENGTVTKADVVKNSTTSTEVAACVRARLMRMVTPKPDAELNLLVSYRLSTGT